MAQIKFDAKSLISRCKSKIEVGQIVEVRDLIQETLKREKIPRESLANVCELLRRVGDSAKGVWLLHPLVRGSRKTPPDATSAELVEYAGCLANIGARDEARSILRNIDSHLYPQTDLFTAFTYFSEWNYEEAIPALLRYCDHPKIQNYQRLIGQINLLAAFVQTGKYELAEKLLQEFWKSCDEKKHQLLLMNSLEIGAQNYFFKGENKKALHRLQKSEQLLSSGESLNRLFVDKWKHIVQLSEKRKPEALEERTALIQRAKTFNHWETLRELDFYWGTLTRDPLMLQKVFLGTPYPLYKQKFLQRNTSSLETVMTTKFHWTPDENFDLPKKEIKVLSQPTFGKPESVINRTFQILCSDFYQPFNVVSLHSGVFPERHYNPFSSPTLVHQSLFRLRAELKKQLPGWKILEKQERFSIVAPMTQAMEMKESKDSNSILCDQLSQLENSFTLLEAEALLKIRRRTLQRHLARLTRLGLLNSIGATKDRKFSLAFDTVSTYAINNIP